MSQALAGEMVAAKPKENNLGHFLKTMLRLVIATVTWLSLLVLKLLVVHI
jgi:hypothetical protein